MKIRRIRSKGLALVRQSIAKRGPFVRISDLTVSRLVTGEFGVIEGITRFICSPQSS